MAGKKRAGNKKANPVGQGKKPARQDKPEKTALVRGPYRAWETDNATPGSLTSLDVLLGWLSTPGNVELWRNKELKGKLSRDIVKALQKQNIYHRPVGDVSFKIRLLEKQYADGTAYLKDKGKLEAFRRNEVDDDVISDVLQISPQYLQLLQIFGDRPMQQNVEAATSTRPQQVQSVARAKDVEQLNGTGGGQENSSATDDTQRTDAGMTNNGTRNAEVADRIAGTANGQTSVVEGNSNAALEGEQLTTDEANGNNAEAKKNENGVAEDDRDDVANQGSAKEEGDDSDRECWVVVNEKYTAANNKQNGLIEEDDDLKEPRGKANEDNYVVAEEHSADEMEGEGEVHHDGVNADDDVGVDADVESENLAELNDTDEDNLEEGDDNKLDISEEETEEEESQEIDGVTSDAQDEHGDSDGEEYEEAQQEEQSDANDNVESEGPTSSSSEIEHNDTDDIPAIHQTTSANSDSEAEAEAEQEDEDEEVEAEEEEREEEGEDDQQFEREGDSDEAESHRKYRRHARDRSNSSDLPSHSNKRARAASDVHDELQDMKRQALSQQIEDERTNRLQMFHAKNVHLDEMFRLECAALECELKGKQMQLAVDKLLARNKLLNDGIDIAEVDRVIPL
ncbi:hypothetical protein PHYBOEH_006222 [Phytophthora boehmeriae]|uniref:Uncharacterized protein n=1 Tax=Phytophthora boehmeriae TaxID=109152 RepID=A0A8T1WLP0_9STRA|nr:hypothetical protein PHYBOEH_006222 [Phytophthora boehmeriae]